MRGVACLLLVAFHAIGAEATSGMHVPDGSPFREFTNLFVHVRMPLFTFLSGLVYAYRPLRAGQALRFSSKKLRRLGIPLVVTATLLYCGHALAHDPVPPLARLWTIYLFPYWHLWFVQALLIVFALLVVLELLDALSTPARFAAVFALAVALFFYGPFKDPNIFGLYNATFLLPFFLWGLATHRFRDLWQSRPALIVTLGCFVVAQGLHTYVVLTQALPPIDPVEHRSAWNLMIGMSGGLGAVQLLPRARVLEKIGASSYPIYLYHPLFIAVLFAGVHARRFSPSTGLLFTGACMVGVAGPMIVERVAKRIPGGSLLLEGRPGSTTVRPDEALASSRRAPTSPVDVRIERLSDRFGSEPT